MSGKAYAKAIRVHFLTQAALAQLVLQYLPNTNAEEGDIPQNVALNDMPKQLSVTETHILESETVYK